MSRPCYYALLEPVLRPPAYRLAYSTPPITVFEETHIGKLAGTLNSSPAFNVTKFRISEFVMRVCVT